MKPYYEHAGVTIYHGDCLEFMEYGRGSGLTDHVVTDPPYGLGIARWDNDIPHWLELARKYGHTVAFTTAPTTLWDYPRADWVLCWDRPAACSRTNYGGFNHWTPVVVYGRGQWSPDRFVFQRPQESWLAEHPSPKPQELFHWVLSGISGTYVFDPFCGTGGVLVAAKTLGRRAIGIELEERYCELAAKRLRQEILPFAENRA